MLQRPRESRHPAIADSVLGKAAIEPQRISKSTDHQPPTLTKWETSQGSGQGPGSGPELGLVNVILAGDFNTQPKELPELESATFLRRLERVEYPPEVMNHPRPRSP